MTSAPLTGFCNVDLAFSDHLVLGKLSFEIGRAIVYVVVPFGRGKPRRCASAAGLIAPPGRGVRRKLGRKGLRSSRDAPLFCDLGCSHRAKPLADCCSAFGQTVEI
jgi:hypothetical protein